MRQIGQLPRIMARNLETKRHMEFCINGFLGKARGRKMTPNRVREQ